MSLIEIQISHNVQVTAVLAGNASDQRDFTGLVLLNGTMIGADRMEDGDAVRHG